MKLLLSVARSIELAACEIMNPLNRVFKKKKKKKATLFYFCLSQKNSNFLLLSERRNMYIK